MRSLIEQRRCAALITAFSLSFAFSAARAQFPTNGPSGDPVYTGSNPSYSQEAASGYSYPSYATSPNSVATRTTISDSIPANARSGNSVPSFNSPASHTSEYAPPAHAYLARAYSEQDTYRISDGEVAPSLSGDWMETEPQRGWLDGFQGICCEVMQDHINYYSIETLVPTMVAYAAGAAIANSDADESLRDWWQNDVRNDSWDNFSKVTKTFGEGEFVIAVAATSWLLGEMTSHTAIGSFGGEWGERTLRSYIVGTPPMLVMQRITGASRPGETSAESDWVLLGDSNGVSGHAFMGAVPFITAAQMSDRPMVKASLYAASTLTALSRVNDDAHYTSQAVLGWWMAYIAASSVNRSGCWHHNWSFVPWTSLNDARGIALVVEH